MSRNVRKRGNPNFLTGGAGVGSPCSLSVLYSAKVCSYFWYQFPSSVLSGFTQKSLKCPFLTYYHRLAVYFFIDRYSYVVFRKATTSISSGVTVYYIDYPINGSFC